MTKPEADTEVRQILELYRRVYEELLAVPVIPGVKSEKEKFAGGLYTTTVEGFIPTTGRGIQGATSHCLGQNFSRPEMFNIVVEDPNDPTGQGKIHVWQNSWGLSTRTIGVMVMTHGDNQGLVLPPRIAAIQVVIVPCGITAKTSDEQRKTINDKCEELAQQLKKVGIKAKADLRDVYTPGFKFNDWEQKVCFPFLVYSKSHFLICLAQGVPLRLEIGPADLSKAQTISVRRDTGVKSPIPLAQLNTAVPELLESIQNDLFKKAQENYYSRLREITKWEDVVPALDDKCVVALPWCEEEACEDDIKDRSAQAYVHYHTLITLSILKKLYSIVLSPLTSVLPLLVPSRFAFPSTSLAGLLSSLVRRSARRVAKMQSAGPCSVVRISSAFKVMLPWCPFLVTMSSL